MACPSTGHAAERLEEKPRWSRLSIVAFVAGLVCFIQTVRYDFICDDEFFIRDNPAIRTFVHPMRFLTDRHTYAHNEGWYIYRPLAAFTYALNYAVDGLHPRGYHLVSVLLHAINGALLYLVLLGLFRGWMPAMGGALLFVVHPVQTESVSWVSGRSNVLLMCFMLLGMLAHMRQFRRNSGRGPWQALGGLAYVMALLSKEQAIVLPGFFFLHEWLLVRSEVRGPWLGRVPYYAGLGVIMVGYLVVRDAVLGQSSQRGYWGGSLYATIATMIPVGLVYLRLMVFPAWLRVVYDAPEYLRTTMWSAGVLVSLAVEVGILAGAALCYRRKPLVTFAMGVMVLGFLPVSNLLPMQSIVNERFMYVSMMGFAVLFGDALEWTHGRLTGVSRKWGKTVPAAGLVILLVLAGLTVRRNMDWANAGTLFEPNRALAPENWRVHFVLANYYMQEKEIEKAVAEYIECNRLRPGYPVSHYNLALCYMRLKRPDRAVGEYAEVVREEPGNTAAHLGLGAALMSMGRIVEAEMALRRLEGIDPDCLGVHDNLGKVLVVMGRFKEGEREFEGAVRREPENGPLRAELEKIRKGAELAGKAQALREEGAHDRAVAAYEEALVAVPYAASLRYELAQVYAGRGRGAEAIRELELAFRLNRRDERILSALTGLLEKTGAVERAAGVLREVLSELPVGDPMRAKLEAELAGLRSSPSRER